MTTMKERPLWEQRFMLVVMLPLFLLLILLMAVIEAWGEFWPTLKSGLNDILKIWKGAP